jgi:hypothetical protein
MAWLDGDPGRAAAIYAAIGSRPDEADARGMRKPVRLDAAGE